MEYFIKKNVNEHEFKMHNYIYSLGVFNVPKIINYDKKNKPYYAIILCFSNIMFSHN
mgnify:CR=1 FL=1